MTLFYVESPRMGFFLFRSISWNRCREELLHQYGTANEPYHIVEATKQHLEKVAAQVELRKQKEKEHIAHICPKCNGTGKI